MSPMEQARMKMPYAQCTLGVYELVKLKYYIKNNKITVFEPSGCRKDRYSSIAYNYWCASQLELQLRPHNEDTQSLVERLTIKKRTFKYENIIGGALWLEERQPNTMQRIAHQINK